MRKKEVKRTMAKTSPEVVYKELLKSKPVSIVIDHDLPGVTPEMIDWWWDNIDNNNYKMWHPGDHHTLEWQIPPSKVGHVGAICMACECISEVPYDILRIRWEDTSAAPVSRVYSHALVASILGPGPEDIPMASIVHEYEATSNGSKMRSTFTFPGGTPLANRRFLDAMRRHNIAEMGMFPEFLPQLYRQKTRK